MPHKEYIRLVAGSPTAVLFIHGILGTPDHFNKFIPLVPKEYSVYNLLLDGHGKHAADFSKTSMAVWEAQVSEAVAQLSASHHTVYIVAHSLGTLLAIEQAVKTKAIAGLFLLAVPMRITLRSGMVIRSLKVYFNAIRPDDVWTLAAKRCCGVALDRNPLHYPGWIPRFFELFVKICRTRRIIDALDTPCTAYQSQKDEIVSAKSIDCLQKNPCITIKTLKHSGHYYYADTDRDFLLAEFSRMLHTGKTAADML